MYRILALALEEKLRVSQASYDPDFILVEGIRQLALLCDSHPSDHKDHR